MQFQIPFTNWKIGKSQADTEWEARFKIKAAENSFKKFIEGTKEAFSKFSREANEAFDSNRMTDYEFAARQCQSILNRERKAKTKLLVLSGKQSTLNETKLMVLYQGAENAFNVATKALIRMLNIPGMATESQKTNSDFTKCKEEMDMALEGGLEEDTGTQEGGISLDDVKKMISADRKVAEIDKAAQVRLDLSSISSELAEFKEKFKQ